VLKSKSPPILAGAAALMLAVGVATPASAGIVSLGPGSPITVTGISGVGTLTFSPTPATEILAVTDPQFSADFPNQDPTTVATGVATLFSIPTPTLTANNESLTNPFTESVPSGFDYAAIHNDTGEIVFAYNTTQTSFTLNNSDGALSNARFYEGVPVPAPLIGHGLLVLLAVGGVLCGGKLLENLKKRRSLNPISGSLIRR
jgi:hypothetical protein